MLKSELIEENKNLVQQNGGLMYLLEFGKLRCEDSKGRMIWKRDSNAWLLQNRINKTIEFCNYLLENNEIEIDGVKYYKQESDDVITRAILEKIKGGSNEKSIR